MLNLVDSHCHLNFEPLGQNVDQVLARARENGVGHILCVSVNLEDHPQVLSLAREHDNIYASVGVHPNERNGKDPVTDEIVALAQDPSVVAIGETGLDYYRTDKAMDWQQERFRRHIHAACKTDTPLIIHTREAINDVLRIMKEEGAGKAGGVMHCFVDNWDAARQAMDMGFYISFSGIVTFKSAVELREVVNRIPLDRMLVETDAPYLAPVPYRGKTNEPAYVRHVAECIAGLRGMVLEELAEKTTENFFRLFRTAAG